MVQAGGPGQAQHPQGAHQRAQLQGEHGHAHQVRIHTMQLAKAQSLRQYDGYGS